MKGHADRICRVAFHPSGDYVASASFDTSWRLWDVATAKELLLQEGHSKEVYSVEFQDDGALVASGSVLPPIDSLTLTLLPVVWTPSGASGIYAPAERPWSSTATSKPFLALHFPQMGAYSLFILSSLLKKNLFVGPSYQIATGAGDDTIRIWDMRYLKALYTIPAHVSNVADVRFFRSDGLPPTVPINEVVMNGVEEEADVDKSGDGDDDDGAEWGYRSGLYFASAGYDGFVKLWSADDWQLLRTLTTDSGKVMSVDLTTDGRLLASGTYNRNFQLFAPEDVTV